MRSTNAGVAYGFVYDFAEQKKQGNALFENVEQLEERLDELNSDYSVIDADGVWNQVIITEKEISASSEMGGGFVGFNSPSKDTIEGLREIREQLGIESPMKWYFYMYFEI